MYLISAVVKNYRLHKELKVDFDESRTIIGGPNETGKSTLLEAIHHALFLKAKGNKKEHREMKSALFLGDPEVELEFVVHEVKYKLAKRFGSNGTGSLSIEGTGTLYNADADDKLFSLLGEDAGTNQWAHLWIKQGESGLDPSSYANEQRNELLLQLQKHGAAAVVQSEIDTRIANQFEAEINSIFTGTGKVKKDSDLGRAFDEVQSRMENLSIAESRLQRLDAAAADLESVETELPQVLLALKNLKDDKEVLEAKEKSLQELKEKSKEEKHAENDAKEKLKQLVETNDLIIKQAKAIKKAENSIGPAEEELKQLDQKIRIVKDLTIQAEVEYNLAFQAQQSARDLMDFANVSRQHIEYSDQLKKIKSALVKANKIQDDIIAKTKKLAEITLVEKKDLAKLQKLESKVSETVAVLEAMAAGLEVVKADQQIMVAGKSVKKGDKVILTEDTEIEAGKGIKFRITPGGGTSLAEARSSMSDANAEFKKKLNENTKKRDEKNKIKITLFIFYL